MSKNNNYTRSDEKRKKWPENCIWPEPVWDGEGFRWDWDLAEIMELDEEGEELKEIKYYMDELVDEGRLNPDYSLNEDYEEDEGEDEDEDEDEPWTPEKGIDYWEDGFDAETWEYDLSHHINLLKIESCDPENDPIIAIRAIIGYDFINENLLRQAFTRRAFALEYGLSECSEELEFYGDSIINTVVTQEIYKRFSSPCICDVDGPFQSLYDEGDLTKIRSKFVSREHLAARAAELGLDKFILYGSGEEVSESAREDMLEALVGAVAADSGWKWPVLEDVIDRLINLQLESPDKFLKITYYEQLNSWHQKRFGRMPEYEIRRSIKGNYSCCLRYSVPENNKGIWTAQRIDEEDAPTRSDAREYAARQAVCFIRNHGLWIRLEDAGIEPELESSINQLQELYQKKYIPRPEYTFEEDLNGWQCECTVDNIDGFGKAAGKTMAKKKAAFMVLVNLMMSAGLSTKELEHAMWKTLAD